MPCTDGEVLGYEVIGNAFGGAENDAGACANTMRYFSGSSNGLENDLLCRRQRQERSGEPTQITPLYGLLGPADLGEGLAGLSMVFAVAAV